MPRITPWRLMSIMRRAVTSSSSTKRPSGMIPALLTTTSSGPELLLGVVQERAKDSRSVTSSGSATVRAPSSAAVRSAAAQVHVADRDPHALVQERLRGRAADAARGAGDRRRLAGEDTGLLGHRISPPVSLPRARRAVQR